MKITMRQIPELKEPEIIICGDMSSKQVKNIIELLSGKQYLQKMFFFKDGREYLFDLSEVVYFEAHNNKTYAQVDGGVYEVRQKLYELETMGASKGFVRISKGIIVNINYVASVAAEFSGNYTLKLKNFKTPLTISRKYVKGFKNYVMEEY